MNATKITTTVWVTPDQAELCVYVKKEVTLMTHNRGEIKKRVFQTGMLQTSPNNYIHHVTEEDLVKNGLVCLKEL